VLVRGLVTLAITFVLFATGVTCVNRLIIEPPKNQPHQPTQAPSEGNFSVTLVTNQEEYTAPSWEKLVAKLPQDSSSFRADYDAASSAHDVQRTTKVLEALWSQYKTPEVGNALADAYEYAHDPRRAISVLSTLAIDASNHAWARLGMAYLLSGHVDEAIQSLEKSLAVDGTSAVVYSNLATAYWGKADYRGAESTARAGLARFPDASSLYYSLAQTYFKMENLREAVSAYKDAIDLDPKSVMALNNLGLALQHMGYEDTAVQYWDYADRLNIPHAPLYLNLGQAAADSGNLEKAASYYQRALATDPDYSQARLALASILLQQEKFSEAREQMLAGSSSHGLSPEVMSEMLVTIAGQGAFSVALKFCKEFANAVQETCPIVRRLEELSHQNSADSKLKMGAIFSGTLGLHQTGLRYFDMAEKMSSQPASAIYSKGVTYLLMKSYGKAEFEFRLTLTVDPNYLGAKINLVAVYRLSGARSEEIKAIEDILEGATDKVVQFLEVERYGQLFKRLAELLIEEDRRREALQVLNRYAKLPDRYKDAAVMKQLRSMVTHP
jgi:tetratricopeptide (TPR) repeat protein